MPRKVQSNAILLNLPPELQEQIIAWADTPKTAACPGGHIHAVKQLEAAGIKTTRQAVSVFYRSWHLRQDLDLARQFEEMIKKAKPGRSKTAREVAESMLLGLSLARQDEKLFTAASRSMDSRRQIELREDAQRLANDKYQRDYCEGYLRWQADEHVKQIVESGASHAEKIAALGRHMFGEAWNE